MFELGKTQKMKINNITKIGAYLDAETGNADDNILLPNNQLTDDIKEGDEVEVFIYRDSEDRVIATCKKPFIEKDEIALLEVVDVNKIGAFLNFGLERDLFLPFKEQKVRVRKGDVVLVALYIDSKERLAATTYVSEYFRYDSNFKKNDVVKGIVYNFEPYIGAFVLIDKKYTALIPKDQIFSPIEVGAEIEARISTIHSDGKLVLSLKQEAYKQRLEDSDFIYEYLKSGNGFMALNDDSSPELIKKKLNISKKSFKRAIGKLLKEKKIEITAKGIKLI